MLKRVLNLIFFGLLTGLFWYLKGLDIDPNFTKWYYTFLAFTVTYFIFKFVFQELLSRPITNAEMRYKFRKTVSILYWVVFVIIFIRIWIVNPQALLVAYGLVAAGVAISLQDFFKNFVGGITIFINGTFKVGDRIEVNGEFGDVIDVGLMYTTVLELREWVAGDQTTGRICSLPNGYVLSYVVNNYTKDHKFIWDEIFVPVTYDSDWKAAIEMIQSIVEKETRDYAEQAEREIARIKEKYFISKREVRANVFVEATDNWISLRVRYVVPVRERRLVHNKLTKLLLEELDKTKKITVASQSIDIVGFPGK